MKHTQFPSSIRGYTFLREISHSNHLNAFALYRSPKGKTVIGKFLFATHVRRAVNEFDTEVAIYRSLGGISDNKTSVPSFVFSTKTASYDAVFTTYIQNASSAAVFSDTALRQAVTNILHFLSFCYTNKRRSLVSAIPTMRPTDWLRLAAKRLLISCIRHPQHTPLILSAFVAALHHRSTITKDISVTLVHRDLKPDNILSSGTNIWLIDWQLACISSPLVEQANILHDLWAKESIRNDILQSAKKTRNETLLAVYTILLAIYHLSLPWQEQVPASIDCLRFAKNMVSQSL